MADIHSLSKARKAKARASKAVQAAENRLNTLSADLDPNCNVQDPNRLQKIQEERAKAMAARDAAQATLAAARTAQAELEEEARRAGIDRRWLSGNDR